MNIIRAVFSIGILSMGLLSCSGEQPRPAQSTVQQTPSHSMAIPEFQGNSAFAYLLKQTSFGPRNPGSSGHKACLTYLSSTLSGLADKVSQQEFRHTGYHNESLLLTNIFASFRPELPARVLFLAHWDTRPRAERDPDPKRRDEPILGANDGASGVAVLLEIARLLKQQPPPVGVDILLVDGEDYGREGDENFYLLGARHFAANKPPDYAPRFGILLDMIGDAYLEIPQEQNSLRFAPDVIRLVWGKAHELGVTQFIPVPGEEVMDDHLPLNEAGIKTIDLIDFNYPDRSNRYWHTHQDTPDHCSSESLEAVGTVLTHVLYSQTP